MEGCGPQTPVNHASWIAVITPISPQSSCNRSFWCHFVLLLCFLKFFCWYRGFCHRIESDLFLFIRPSSDGTYYGMAMSVRVSIRVSVRPSVHPSVRPTLRPSGLRPPIFRTFLLHALTYWAEILHMTLFWCTTDQVRLSSLCVNFWRSYASLWT